MNCGRCKLPIQHGRFFSDTCWYCLSCMCDDCWEEHGHCGHPEAIAINEASRTHSLGRGGDISICEVIEVAKAGGVEAVRALCEEPS